jgi:hypothetical protein
LFALESRLQQSKWIETPELAIRYGYLISGSGHVQWRS